MLITIGRNNKEKYTDTQTNNDAEDSSYDSEDCENDKTQYLLSTKDRNNQRQQQQPQNLSSKDSNIDHEQVSRTTSDTLGQEFAEYVTNTGAAAGNSVVGQSDTSKSMANVAAANAVAYSTAYKARVEFALKLGYTERLVQTALARLGSDPTQNELLAELITLGAQYSNKSDFACESPTAECLSSKNCTQKISAGSGIGLSGISTGIISMNDSHNMLIMQNSNSTSDELNQLNCLRPIVVDGSNVAMSHGNKEIFSCRGIKLAVDWFKNRGHKDITVFVPKWRKESSRPDNPIKDQEILNELERERMLVFTPSRLVGGKRMVCYDDRYILKLAVDNDGIVVSNDNYRDLVQESSEFKKVVEERVLMFSFVNDRFMPPDDPLGRSGPTLDNFLRTQPKKSDPPPPCPYGKKCTYGNKCKFHHPERGIGPHKSVTERLSEHAARHLLARNSSSESTRTPVQGKSLSVPLCGSGETINNCYSAAPNTNERPNRKALCRSRSGVPDTLNQQQQHLTKSLHTQQQQQQQKQHQHHQNTMSAAAHPIWGTTAAYHHPLDKNSDPTNVGFLKSHSIENISRDIFPHSMNTPPPNYPSMWSPQNVNTSVSSSMGNIPPLSRSQNQSNDKNDENGVNLHRKLQRQLTLNPAGCDPRIYQMQRCVTPSNVDGTSAGGQSSHSPHRPLAPSLSGPRNYRPNQWDLHQSVTRIASAPDPSRPSHNGPPPASSSEPHINLWPHHKSSSAQDQRRRLHYHLASIFPEEQVQTAMQMYPDETNPQTICAAILSMFS